MGLGVSKNNGTPKSSILIGVSMGFHYKPSILGYPYFWKHPYSLVLASFSPNGNRDHEDFFFESKSAGGFWKLILRINLETFPNEEVEFLLVSLLTNFLFTSLVSYRKGVSKETFKGRN